MFNFLQQKLINTKQQKALANIKETDFLQQLYEKNVELLEERRRIEQLLYNVSEAVFSIDSTFKITLFNRFAENMLGLELKDAIGRSIDELILLKTETGDPVNLKQYCFAKEVHNSLDSHLLVTPVAQYYVNIKTSTIELSTEKKECLVTMTNITKEKMLEKTKNDFVSVTSHELRTPMTIIKSYLWMVFSEKGGPVTTKQREYLDKALKGAERMLALINDTLSISRIDRGRMEFKIESIDYQALLSEMEMEFKVKTDEKHLALKMEISSDVRNVFADSNKLREIITNLVGNAVKFTINGGITVKCEPIEGGYIKTSVIDTGKGVRQEDLDKLFLKFGRLDNSYTTVAESGGTGLGLYIVKSLTEAMGGKAGGTSLGLGKGSSFWFTLPSFDIAAKGYVKS